MKKPCIHARRFFVALLVVIAVINGSGSLFGQNSNMKAPEWIRTLHPPESDFYYYFIGVGTAASIDSAKIMATRKVILDYAESQGMQYIVGSKSELREQEILKGHERREFSNFQFQAAIEGQKKTITIPCMSIVDFYLDHEINNNAYQNKYCILVRIPKSDQASCKAAFYKNKGTPVILSVFVPGMGQLYKQQKLKGWLIFSGEIASVAMIFIGQYGYVKNYDDANGITNPAIRQTYIDRGNTWAAVSLGSGIAAALIYIYNIVDVSVSTGAKRYVSNAIQVYPNYCDSRPQLTLKIKL